MRPRTRLPIWAIPEVVKLPLAQVETLQILSDLLPYLSLPLRDLTACEPTLRTWCEQHDTRVRWLDFEHWISEGARLGLLRWSERDALIETLRAQTGTWALNARS